MAPRSLTAPSGSARICRSRARAGCAAPAAPGSPPARSPCAATTPWSRRSSTRALFSPASPCPPPIRSPSTTTPSRKEPAMPDLTSPGGDLEPIERASADELRALQFERLRWTLRHAYANVPHYRAAFDAAGVHPDDCKDVADLAKYPLTSKADLRENYPFGMFAVPREQVVRVHASSGTTVPATACTTPTATGCSPEASGRTTAARSSAAPWSRSPAG